MTDRSTLDKTRTIFRGLILGVTAAEIGVAWWACAITADGNVWAAAALTAIFAGWAALMLRYINRTPRR